MTALSTRLSGFVLHADESAVLDLAGMQQRHVPDRDVAHQP
jgi:hypothetical protein